MMVNNIEIRNIKYSQVRKYFNLSRGLYKIIFIHVFVLFFCSVHGEAQEYKNTVVCDSVTHKPLEFAVVAVNNSTGKNIYRASTDSKGVFQFRKDIKEPVTLKVSFLGYKPYTKTLNSKSAFPATIYLSPVSIDLKEVQVVASKEIHNIDKDVYLVTDKMRKGMSIAAQMLGNIKGIMYNYMDKTISVYGQSNVLLLVNGVEKSSDYIKNINPKRIACVEIAHNPGGRYLSDNYAAIINLILYEDYVGWDLYGEDETKIKMDDLDAPEWLRREVPSFNYTYTRNKITINTDYKYTKEKNALSPYFETEYPGLIKNITTNASDDGRSIRNNNNQHAVDCAVDYKITPKHTISLTGNFSYDDNLAYGNLLYITETSAGKENTVSHTRNRTYNSNGVGRVFYQGKVGAKWNLYSDFSYNYYKNNSLMNRYQTDWTTINNKYCGKKNYTRFNAEASYVMSKAMQVKFGYTNTWKEYGVENGITGEQDSKLYNYRNALYGNMEYKINNKWSTSVGANAEFIRNKQGDMDKHYFVFMPNLRLMYKPSQSFYAVLQYQSTVGYPDLWELSDTKVRTDSITYKVGNPLLKQYVNHNLNLRVSLWKDLTLLSSIKHTKDAVNSWLEQNEENQMLRTYVNASTYNYSVSLDYQKSFLKYFRFSTNMSYNKDELEYKDIKHTIYYFTSSSQLSYSNNKSLLFMTMQYQQFSRKVLTLQSYSNSVNNSWVFSVQKGFLKGRLAVMGGYILPVSFLCKQTYSDVTDTPFYKSYSKMNMFNLAKNILMLRICYRFDYGKRTNKTNYIYNIDPEKGNNNSIF